MQAHGDVRDGFDEHSLHGKAGRHPRLSLMASPPLGGDCGSAGDGGYTSYGVANPRSYEPLPAVATTTYR
jgi:hypothetical protein